MGIARRGNSGAVRRSGHRKHRSLEALRREPLEGHGDAVVVRDEAEELAAGNHEDPGGSPGEDVDGERPGGQEFRLAVMLAMMEEPVRRPLADDLALAALSAHQIADQRFVIDHQNAGRSGSGTTHQGDLRGLRRCGLGHVEKGGKRISASQTDLKPPQSHRLGGRPRPRHHRALDLWRPLCFGRFPGRCNPLSYPFSLHALYLPGTASVPV